MSEKDLKSKIYDISFENKALREENIKLRQKYFQMMDRYDDFYNSFLTIFDRLDRLERVLKKKEDLDDDIEVYDDEENIDIFNMSMPGPDDDNADIWLKK